MFDTNRATIENVLSVPSGISEYFADEVDLRQRLWADPVHVSTLEQKLATVAAERGSVG